MDTVHVHNICLKGRHGVGESERRVEQEFLIDIDATIDLSLPEKSDALGDTANYAEFVAVVREVVEKNSFYLIEKLAGSIAEKILLDARIQNVRITIRKPAVLKDAMPGVTIERGR